MKVVVIDYGSGNLRSVVKAFEKAANDAGLDNQICLTSRSEDLRDADQIVLPGVGAFADCRAGLDGVPGMVEALNERVQKDGIPFLGICVGMQLLASRGLEKQTTDGLGWIDGDVVMLDPKNANLKVPQIGWNSLDVRSSHPVLDGIELGAAGLHAYFVHSYHFLTEQSSRIVATTDYGEPVTAMVAQDNIVGTQFHPEKSQALGLSLIANFLRWRP